MNNATTDVLLPSNSTSTINSEKNISDITVGNNVVGKQLNESQITPTTMVEPTIKPKPKIVSPVIETPPKNERKYIKENPEVVDTVSR